MTKYVNARTPSISITGRCSRYSRFERVDAADVDELERELHPALRLADDLDRPVAEVTALGVVERDPAHARSGRYG